MHADFLRINANQVMTMTVQFHFIGADVAPGVKEGGAISHLMSDIEIACLPKDLPEYIEVDISELELDASIHLTELVLPEGVSLTALSHAQDEELEEGERSSYDQAVVNIHTPRVVVEVEEDDVIAASDVEVAGDDEAEKASED